MKSKFFYALYVLKLSNVSNILQQISVVEDESNVLKIWSPVLFIVCKTIIHVIENGRVLLFNPVS